ncbi:hypothetical protein GCM10011579_057940 [Streptomyces albiflavescens]|uniref:Uncharacterized protein n=1 Tax=Streptomyces albiflavescens TaxID=1623582 RepID=A0A917YAF8_9ACTN|nr:hypothetical protein GCM10011579_057940 [Streptomyces albiflavescens]
MVHQKLLRPGAVVRADFALHSRQDKVSRQAHQALRGDDRSAVSRGVSPCAPAAHTVPPDRADIHGGPRRAPLVSSA